MTKMVSVPGRAYEIGAYAVTFEDWDKYATETGGYRPSDCGWGRGQRPVINVSWNDVQKYIEWRNQTVGKGFRLPTEEEWEFACRAGTTTDYNNGRDKIRTDEARFDSDNTVPVGSYAPNAWGLYDMHGNVWEWTSSKCDTKSSLRVLRGGSWNFYPRVVRSGSRIGGSTGNRFNSSGFRLARTIESSVLASLPLARPESE